MLLLHHLPGQRDFEKLIFCLRPHWFIIFLRLLFYILLAFIPVILYFLLKNLFPSLLTNDLAYTLLLLLASIYYLSLWLFLFHSFLDYYLDTWIITNDRILNIEQRGMFSRTVSELKLYRVQDVTSEIHGFFATFLDYGDVYVQTAGEKERFHFKKIPDPYEVRKKISSLAEEDKKFHEKGEHP